MIKTFSKSILAVAVCLAAAVGSAQAEQTCFVATASGGPVLGKNRAFDRAVGKIGRSARQTEAKIRRAHSANGFNAGEARYGRMSVDCFRPDPQKFKTKCVARQQVCVDYTKVRDCPLDQYYSAAARRCVTLQ